MHNFNKQINGKTILGGTDTSVCLSVTSVYYGQMIRH